jgi:uroporphyrinogen-III synthase
MRVLVTRPQADAERTAGRLAILGHEAIIAPATAIVMTAGLPPREYDALVLTSAHAVPALRDAPKDRPVFAVGARTASAARAAGFADVREGPGDAAGLAAIIEASLPARAALLHPAGRDRKSEPERSLRAAGYELQVVECYAAEPLGSFPEEALAALRAGRVGAALHYSRRSAALAREFAAKGGAAEPFGALRHLCLSADVAQALTGLSVQVAPDATEPSLLALL